MFGQGCGVVIQEAGLEGACERSQTYNENPGKDDAIVRFKANVVTIVP